LVEGVSVKMANIVFDKATQKVIKDAVKHACLVLLTVLKHLLYLMTNYYLITIFVVLLTSVSHGVKALLYPILAGATAYLAGSFAFAGTKKAAGRCMQPVRRTCQENVLSVSRSRMLASWRQAYRGPVPATTRSLSGRVWTRCDWKQPSIQWHLDNKPSLVHRPACP
jgi:hypothetical protein